MRLITSFIAIVKLFFVSRAMSGLPANISSNCELESIELFRNSPDFLELLNAKLNSLNFAAEILELDNKKSNRRQIVAHSQRT